MTCNGAKRPDSTHPFLTPPYHGWTAIVSIFDHDSPNFLQDGLTVATTGAQAMPDSAHHRTDFPAYWNGTLRQYLDYDGHNGYDYDLSYQPVYAAAAGKVLFAALEYPDAPDHGYGNMVMIDHHNGYVTLYGHFSKLLVKVGQKVKRGQKIGISGNTGHSTGPHLHFTVFHNCTPTDPYGWSGSGEDPLVSYQGETSTYLWSRAPQILNPLPNWPGLSALSGVPGMRRLLLRLPSTRLGAKVFETSVHNRAERAEERTGAPGNSRTHRHVACIGRLLISGYAFRFVSDAVRGLDRIAWQRRRDQSRCAGRSGRRRTCDREAPGTAGTLAIMDRVPGETRGTHRAGR